MTQAGMSVYAYWRARHKTPHDQCKDKVLPFEHWDHPQAGLWKINIGGGYRDGVKQPRKFVPMQIWWQTPDGEVKHTWEDGLEIGGLIDGDPASANHLSSRWLGCEHLTKAAKDAYFEAGKVWPEDPPPPAVQAPAPAPAPSSAEAALGLPPLPPDAVGSVPGHNSLDLDSYEGMRDALLGEIKECEQTLKKKPITTLADANYYENWRDRIAKMANKADERRKLLKKPLDAAVKEHDEKWFAFIRSGSSFATKLKDLVDRFAAAEQEKLRQEALARAKAEHDAAMKKKQEEDTRQKEEHDRIMAERADLMENDPIAALTGSLPELPDDLPAAPPQKFEPVITAPKIMLGTTGTRRSVKEPPATAVIIDLKAAAVFFAEQRHPDLIAAIQKLADKAAKSRAIVPGCAMSWQKETTA